MTTASATRTESDDMEMNPTKCPRCGGDNVMFSEIEWNWGNYSQSGDCLDCGCSWTDVFTLHERAIDEEE